MSILDLPKDIIALIALELNLPDIMNFATSNKYFNSAISKESFWYNKLERDFPDYSQIWMTYRKTYCSLYDNFYSTKVVEFNYYITSDEKETIYNALPVNFTKLEYDLLFTNGPEYRTFQCPEKGFWGSNPIFANLKYVMEKLGCHIYQESVHEICKKINDDIMSRIKTKF